MTGPALATFQAETAAALRAEQPDARPAGLDGPAAARFAVYRNNFRHGLVQQLGEAYSAVRLLVGENFFAAMARAFIAAYPPQKRSLALYGAEFADFLQSFSPAASLPYLPDVARLERAWLEALHARDAAALEPAAAAALGERLPTARFVVHPATRLVRSPHPIVELWRSNRPGARPGARRIAGIAQAALITRPRLTVEVQALTPAQAAFAGGLCTGDTVAAACDAAHEVGPFDLVESFRLLLASGAMTAIHQGNPDSEHQGSATA